MSIDVEDQLSRLLDELADELDVPERWGSLEDLADADLRQVGPRPRSRSPSPWQPPSCSSRARR